MPYILAGVLILYLALFGTRAFARANPAALALALRRFASLGVLALAGLALLRGSLDGALVLAAFGLWLLVGARKSPPARSGPGTGRRTGATSRLRSAVIEMEVDHASGVMCGTVLAGPDEGKSLAHMTREQCEALHRLCLSDDPEGARLLEAYLDRRFPGWRAAGNEGADTRSRRAQARSRPGVMSEDEAYEVLGLHKGATRDDVMRSHRSLIKKLHPDHGGPTDLAARVNEAKDVLMRRHH
ncbi:molecular chaperone DnaJ [Methylovirgula ligni]|uniref:DnaJ-like protein n=1 Tax=Methylovirgula ligni TaxID=569860 RepID=A0A3D9Z9Y3_9HYPH|nr:DnaJ domain-containing protein [Methylovirgula ligni]QAY96876.1 molecular chaperone DnaJ [Methylovirgula ligni]REF88076.1 DnaJ-like protein [Methylovirgula ligni]